MMSRIRTILNQMTLKQADVLDIVAEIIDAKDAEISKLEQAVEDLADRNVVLHTRCEKQLREIKWLKECLANA